MHHPISCEAYICHCWFYLESWFFNFCMPFFTATFVLWCRSELTDSFLGRGISFVISFKCVLRKASKLDMCLKLDSCTWSWTLFQCHDFWIQASMQTGMQGMASLPRTTTWAVSNWMLNSLNYSVNCCFICSGGG